MSISIKILRISVFSLFLFGYAEAAERIASQKYDLGMLSSDVRLISLPMKVENASSSPLLLQTVKGSCSCFLGYTGPKEIKPGESGEITARFNVSSFTSSGSWSTELAILMEREGKEMVGTASVSAAFDSMLAPKVVIVPRVKRISQDLHDESKSSAASFLIFAHEEVADNVQIELDKLDHGMLSTFVPKVSNRQSAGRFVEIGEVSVKLTRKMDRPIFAEMRIPMRVIGAFSRSVTIDCELEVSE